MSFSGMSKADKEIIAQDSSNDRALEIEMLFGMSGAFKDSGSSKIKKGRSSSVNRPARESRGRKIGFEPIEENNELPGPKTQRQPITKSNDDDEVEEDYNDDNDLGAGWDKPIRTKDYKLADKTSLNWSEFV